MRGKLLFLCWRVLGTGITPAGAGKTALAAYGRMLSRDHPRRCGENCIQHPRFRNLGGSPPQVRGKRACIINVMKQLRITPAGAGKTWERQCSSCGKQDHPRRCGENSMKDLQLGIITGSPPQVRGKQGFPSASCVRRRITPAGAGKTINVDCIESDRKDHPRRCGENLTTKQAYRRTPGSPPQVRGKPFIAVFRFTGKRITPAGAGKTNPDDHRSPQSRDHPRRCGENGRPSASRAGK